MLFEGGRFSPGKRGVDRSFFCSCEDDYDAADRFGVGEKREEVLDEAVPPVDAEGEGLVQVF